MNRAILNTILGFQSETCRYYEELNRSASMAYLAALDANIRALKNTPGTTVTIASVTGYLSLASGYYFPTGLSTDLRPYALIPGVSIAFGAGGQTATFSGAMTLGTGETVGGNTFTNPTFDINTAGWSVGTEATLASVAGGYSNNCLEVTRVSGTSQSAHQLLLTTNGALYKFGGYIKAGTSGNEQFWIKPVDTNVLYIDAIATGSWVEHSKYYTKTAALTSYVYLRKNTATPGTMLFDEVYYKQVLTPSATGFLSAALTNTGINPNTGTYTVTITKP